MFSGFRDKIRSVSLLLLAAVVALSGWLTAPTPASAAGAVTLDTPATGTELQPGIVRLAGTYTHAYDLRLFIDGITQVLAVMVDPDGDDTGTWYYDLDTSTYYGEVHITARGLDKDTRYGVWSQAITLHVDNPAAAPPSVTIVSPAEGVSLGGVVDVQVEVQAVAAVQSVEVRIDSGPWQAAVPVGGYYTLQWDTSALGDHTSSIEARAMLAGGKRATSLTTYARVGAGTNEPFRMDGQDRAMWIWESESYKLLLNPGSRDVLDAFARDTATFGSDPIKTLYLAVGPFAGMDIIEDDPQVLRDFIEWAHGLGYQVYACIAGGTSPPYMGAFERYHPMAIREIERVINFNIAAGADAKFDGVNVDIEPYIAPEFKDAYPSLQIQHLDGLRKMIERRNAAGINLPFGPAIPKWYDTSDNAKDIDWNGSTKWLSEHIQDISDYISIMNYRDTADGSAGIIAGAQGEIDYADLIGKPGSVVIGVETLDIANSGDPETITFREEGRAHMEAELDKVYAAFDGNASYGGIAVHHYDSIRILPSHWGDGGVYWQAPADAEPPTAVASGPLARADGYQAVNLSYGMAYDNTEIDRYLIYRSTVDGFAPDASHLVGQARGLSHRDVGLLPDTTYYYRVAARDTRGHIGPLSPQAAVKTGATSLKPAILDGLHVDYAAAGGGQAVAVLRAVDAQTGEPLAGVRVEGRFTYAGGKYVVTTTDADGRATFVSETIPAGQQAGFEPRALSAAGYYLAQSRSQPHTTAWKPWTGLQSLTLTGPGVDAADIELPFETARTRYSVTLPDTAESLTATVRATAADSVVTVNGQRAADGQPSAPIALQPGDNTLRVLVYNREGTVDTYTLDVKRSSAGAGPMDNVFVPVEDAYVYENAPTANYGSETMLEVVDILKANGGGDRSSFLKFNYADYNEPVDSATLYVYVAQPAAKTVDITVEGYGDDSWSEGTVNWNNRPRTGVGSQEIGKIRVTGAGWYSIDVTSFAAEQADGIATIRLSDYGSKEALVQIHSREHAENRPYVLINPSADTTLSTLSIGDGEVAQEPDGDGTRYTATVPNSVDHVAVTAVTSHPRASTSVGGAAVERGEPSEPIALNVGDNPIAVQVTAQDGTVRDYTLVVRRELPGVPEPPKASLIGPASVEEGAQFQMNYAVSDVSEAVYAQDVVVQYDDDLFNFVQAVSLLDGVTVAETEVDPNGSVRLILFSLGEGKAVQGSAEIVKFVFEAGSVQDTAAGVFSITSTLANAQGSETVTATSTHRVEVTADEPEVPEVPGDFNHDGQVSIGDLAVVAVHYGKNSGSADWQQVKKFDLIPDGKIDIADLAAVARLVLGKQT